MPKFGYFDHSIYVLEPLTKLCNLHINLVVFENFVSSDDIRRFWLQIDPLVNDFAHLEISRIFSATIGFNGRLLDVFENKGAVHLTGRGDKARFRPHYDTFWTYNFENLIKSQKGKS